MKNKVPKAITEGWQEQVASRETSNDKDYAIRCIRATLGKDFRAIQKTFSSRGMTESEVLQFLIKETDKVLFQSEDSYVTSILQDYYKETTGSKEILEVIRNFVYWVDLDNRF